jgi:hypothetical protein
MVCAIGGDVRQSEVNLSDLMQLKAARAMRTERAKNVTAFRRTWSGVNS